jgi:hypothetical protein
MLPSISPDQDQPESSQNLPEKPENIDDNNMGNKILGTDTGEPSVMTDNISKTTISSPQAAPDILSEDTIHKLVIQSHDVLLDSAKVQEAIMACDSMAESTERLREEIQSATSETPINHINEDISTLSNNIDSLKDNIQTIRKRFPTPNDLIPIQINQTAIRIRAYSNKINNNIQTEPQLNQTSKDEARANHENIEANLETIEQITTEPTVQAAPERPIQRQARQGLDHSFEKLSNLAENHRPLSASELSTFNRIKKLFIDLKSKIISPDHAEETFRTQEHLLFGKPILPGNHYSTFLNALSSCKLTGNLQKQLSRLDSKFDIYDFLSTRKFGRKASVLAENTWVENTRKNINQLAPGEFMLVDILSAGHSMMMRIEKRRDNEGFNIYFANTGKGIIENPEFHPVQIEEDGTQKYRVVAQIEKVSHTQLLEGGFLKNLIKAIDSDKLEQVYGVLKSLTNENTKLNATDDSRHWNRTQIVGSCSAGCIGVTIRSVLSLEENALLDTQMQVQALVKSYQLLKSNSDRSSTRKIMVLDLVQSLKQNPLLGPEDKEILATIEKDVQESLNMKDPEIMISKSSKISIDAFISDSKLSSFVPVISNEKTLFAPSSESRTSKEQENTTLKAYLSMDNSVKFFENTKYQLIKNDKNQWRGADFPAKAALLCFHVANGDQEQIDFYMDDLLGSLNHPDNELPVHLESILIDLANQFNQLDRTRSGVAKTLFLSGLVLQQFCLRKNINFQDLQKDLWKLNRFEKGQPTKFIEEWQNKTPMTEMEAFVFESAVKIFFKSKYFYANLHVEGHLSDDNPWKKGLEAIEVRQPTLKQPSKSEVMPTLNYHLEDRLHQTDVDVTTDEYAREAFQAFGVRWPDTYASS